MIFATSKKCATIGTRGGLTTTIKPMNICSSWLNGCPWRDRSSRCLESIIYQRQLIPNEQECLDRWLDLGYDLDVFRLAYERTVKHTGKAAIPYANRILQNWKQKGYRNLQDIQAGEPEREQQRPKRPNVLRLGFSGPVLDEVPDYPTKGGSDQ